MRVHPVGGHPRWSLLVLAGCLMALAACGRPGNGAQAGEAEEVHAVPVEVAQAGNRTIAASYTGTASLEALAESQVVAKTSGVALQVLVEEGQVVEAGQALVRLDPDRARLNVAQIEAQMRKLESNYQRAEQLAAQQLISAGEYDQMRYDLENARAAYNLARLELSYTTVTAPISGVIASRSIKTGNFVQINTPIMRIVDNSRLEATLNVPERELAMYLVRDGSAVRTPVQLGHVDAGFVEIREGLAAGDQVVIAGKGALRDGSAVQVIGAGEAAVAAAPAEAAADTDDGNRQ